MAEPTDPYHGYGKTFEDLSPWTFDRKQQLLAELELSR